MRQFTMVNFRNGTREINPHAGARLTSAINMKIKLFGSMAVLSFAMFNSNLLFAKDGADDGPGHHQGETNEIEGTELFHGHVVLIATPAAPTGARGTSELEQENEHGSVFYKVQLSVFGLPSANYQVSAVRISDGSTNVLGDMVVTNSRGRADLLLPSGMTVSDIAQVIVSDSTGTALLVGDVNSDTPGTFLQARSNVKVTPGPGAPQANGRAQIKISQHHGTISQRFILIASKLPANAAVNILADGVQVGTATTNKGGSLVIRSLNVNLLTLNNVSVVFVDDNSEALSVHF
jgi:hypothetical protein